MNRTPAKSFLRHTDTPIPPPRIWELGAHLPDPSRRKSNAGISDNAAAHGFTLIEMMAVLVILSLLLAVTQLALNGISVPWRMRGAAHEVEAVAQWALNAAATRGRPVQVMYDVEEGTWWVWMEEQALSKRRLPGGIRFVSVKFATGIEVMHDVAAARAYPDGTIDPHIVTLGCDGSEKIELTFDRLTGELSSNEHL